jgi:hypothetical protein
MPLCRGFICAFGDLVSHRLGEADPTSAFKVKRIVLNALQIKDS